MSPIPIPGLTGVIHPNIFATRIKDEEYNIFYGVVGSDSKIISIHGYELTFEKDKTEELGSFKMPLMMVGVGVALVY